MPKIELHLHLEGAFTFEFLFYLIEKYGGDREINSAFISNDTKKVLSPKTEMFWRDKKV